MSRAGRAGNVNVARGEFPYRLIDGPKESRYLTWVRNHSNYMAERGFLDYMRIVAILIRGIFINFLTLVPWLILIALVLGVLYNPMLDDWQKQVLAERAEAEAAAASAEVAPDDAGEEAAEAERPDWLFLTRAVTVEKENEPGTDAPADEAAESAETAEPASSLFWNRTGRWVWWLQRAPMSTPPYIFTPWVACVAAFYFFVFPIVIRLFKVQTHNKSLETGRESSVKKRDWFERSFGGFLVAVLAMATIETLPLLVHLFHEVKEGKGLVATVAGGTSIIAASAAGKLISMLGKAKQKIAMVLIGLLGLILPLLVVLYVTDYLVYGEAGYPFGLGWLLVLPAVLVVGVFLALIVGKDALKRTGWVWGLLPKIILPFVALFLLDSFGLLEPSLITVSALAIGLWLFCWLTVDVNLTSVHGLYRDRLASAYLVGVDTKGDVDIEEDIDLHDICTYEARSTSPYHLVNVAHNLQNSTDIGIRERNSDFFIFSRRFVGSRRTGYCRSDSLERVYPQIDLATAMAISAAAAAPNMGTNTSGLMVALLTLLNVRLGYWIPNPGLLEADLVRGSEDERHKEMVAAAERDPEERVRRKDLGYRFEEVFKEELGDVRTRWKNVYADDDGSVPDDTRIEKLRGHHPSDEPSPEHGLIGIGFSGGGIRSATINMGIAQALHRAGVFDHIDYMSTVSGGGYLGSSISTLMRFKTPPYSEVDGTVEEVKTEDGLTTVKVRCDPCSGQDCRSCGGDPARTYLYLADAHLAKGVASGSPAEKGAPLITHELKRGDLRDRYQWRVRPSALAQEMLSRLDETGRWVNLSDGGHIENLATIELLRRRCRFIFIGDGEADANLHFGSLATLIRYARIDLGIRIDIDPQQLRLQKTDAEGPWCSLNHFTIGRIWYPKAPPDEGFEARPGHLIYLKSSFTGDEEEVIQQYRNTHNAFPHESTADQFFDEGQFEAYRALGQHIGERVLTHAPEGADAFDPAPDGSRKAIDIYAKWAAANPDKSVGDFFQAWCDRLEHELPVPWKNAKRGQQQAPPGP